MRGTHKIMTFTQDGKKYNQSQTTGTKTSQFTADQSLPDENRIRK